jgi:putative FmdB family regulatory protein
MPVYEYRCDACQKLTSLFVRSIRNPEPARCRFCRSDRLTRLISRIATPKSEEARMDALADPGSLGGLDENDPQSMARWMKKMAGEMGEDLDDGMMEEMEAAAEDPNAGDEGRTVE